MTKGELKQILGVLDEAGVPDSALVKAGDVPLVLSPVVLVGPGLIYALVNEHWTVAPGEPEQTKEIIFKV